MHHREMRISTIGLTSCKVLTLSIAIAACLPFRATATEPQAASESVVRFSIQAGELSNSIEKFSTQSGIQVMYRPELLANKLVPDVTGSYSPATALARILEGTGLRAERVNGKTYVLKVAPQERTGQKRRATSPARSVGDEAGATAKETKALDAVVVVGSRFGSSVIESAMPVKLITREQIERSGANSIAQVLTYLSEIPINSVGDREIGSGSTVGDGNTNSTTVQMRGLPRGTTLVLVNGRRSGESATFASSGQFDLSTIPLSLVERIEVLPYGSSTIYGGDALAGVINVVLRQDTNGFEARIRESHAPGYGTRNISGVWGRSWARGEVTAAASWGASDGLYTNQRTISSDADFRRYGGTDKRETSASQATVYSLAGCLFTDGYCEIDLSRRAPLPGLGSQFASVPAGGNGSNLRPSDFLPTQGQQARQTRHRHIKSEEKNYGLTANGRVEIRPDLDASFDLMYSSRSVPAWEVPLMISSGRYGIDGTVVGAANPFNPFGVAVGVDYRFDRTGLFTSYSQEHYRGSMGLNGKLGRFDWELTGWTSNDKSRSTGASGFVNSAAIAAALASTNPAKALNVFAGDGSAPGSEELLRSLVSEVDQKNSTRNTGINAILQGVIVNLPAGDLRALLGAEEQKTVIDYKNNIATSLSSLVDGDTSSRAIFTEFRVPLLASRGERSGERLAVNGALRRETSDRFDGAALTKSLGLEIRPWTAVLLRAGYSTAFKPFSTYSAVQDPREIMNFVQDRAVGQGYLIRQYTNGGVPIGIRPETSTTQTMGVVFRPTKDFDFSLTHWDIKFRDQIAFIGVQKIVDNEQLYPERVQRNPVTGRINFVDSRQVNISLRDTAGVDLGFSGSWDTSYGAVHPSLAATYTYRYSQQLTSESPLVSSLGVLNASGWAPKWKIVPRVTWDATEAISTMIAGRYVSKYRDSLALTSGPRTGEFVSLGDLWLVDMNLVLSLKEMSGVSRYLANSTINIGATNILNQLPIYCNSCGLSGYDASQYDIVGRNIYAEIRMNF